MCYTVYIWPWQVVSNKTFKCVLCIISHLIKTLFWLYIVYASWHRHAALPSVSVKAVGRRRSFTERYFTAGRWEALFVNGGRRTPSCKRLLSVMDQLSATEMYIYMIYIWNIERARNYKRKKNIIINYNVILTEEHLSAPGCICLHSLRPHCGFLRSLCQ